MPWTTEPDPTLAPARADVRRPVGASLPRRLARRSLHNLRVASLMLIDSLSLALAVVVSHQLRIGDLASSIFGPPTLALAERLQMFPLYLAVQLLLFSQFDLYGAGDSRRNPWAVVQGLTIGMILLLFASLAYGRMAHPPYILMLAVCAHVTVMGGRQVAEWLRMGAARLGLPGSRVVVLGSGRSANDLLLHPSDLVVEQVELGRFESGEFARLLARSRPDEVLITGYAEAGTLQIVLDRCLEAGCRLRMALPELETVSNPVNLQVVNGQPVLEIVQPRLSISQFALKRALDLVATAVGLLAISPLLAVIAIAIKLDSRGPIFFRQERVTVRGRRFGMLKFRSMHVDAEARLHEVLALNERQDELMFKVARDPRVTRVGKFLRRTSLDELPQLWNVLRGEMSLVGPRPPLPREVERYAPHHHQRLQVLPGMTGLWQVSGRASIRDFEDVVRLDLDYIRNWSLGLDLMILLRTLPAVIRGTGAS